MKDKKVLVITLIAVLLLGGLASISAKTILSDHIMSLIKGSGGECGGQTCPCTTDCSGSKHQCSGPDDCGGVKPCHPKWVCKLTEVIGGYICHGLPGSGSCTLGGCKGGCNLTCLCKGQSSCDCSIGLCYCGS